MNDDTIESLRAERDAALAACAEMRAALTEIIARGQEQRGTGRMIETAEAALLRREDAEGYRMIEDEPAEFERTLQLSCDRLRRRVDEQKARAETAEAERDAALAANAELRAAAVGVDGRCRLCTARPRGHRDNCTLARPDLGRGMVAVPREMVERLVADLSAATPYAETDEGIARVTKDIAILAALLDGGKVRG